MCTPILFPGNESNKSVIFLKKIKLYLHSWLSTFLHYLQRV